MRVEQENLRDLLFTVGSLVASGRTTSEAYELLSSTRSKLRKLRIGEIDDESTKRSEYGDIRKRYAEITGYDLDSPEFQQALETTIDGLLSR